MDTEHVISHEVLDKVQAALFKGENWMVYNNSLYFIEPTEVDFFKTKEEAEEFCQNNHSDHDCFSALYIQSPDDLIKQVAYGDALNGYLNSGFTIQNEKNLNQLKNDLIKLDFSERLFSGLEFYLKYPQPQFQLLERERFQNEKIYYEISFEKTLYTNEYYLAGYEATLRIHPEIPDITIQGVNAKELDKAMQTIDWSIDHHAESLYNEYIETREGFKLLDKIDAILKDINKLYQDEGIGRDGAEKLMCKHWLGEPWEPNMFSLEHVRQNYEWKKRVSIDKNPLQTKSETYAQLKEVASKDLERLNKHFITFQTFVMNEQNLKYLKDNLKYHGFGEKLNPELEANMKQGLPEFQLKIQTEYNKDKIEAVLHFKKSDQSDMYFFNRYDATLQKTNEEKLSQTFYLNKGNGITIKEAYNLLNGRSVNKELTSIEGQKYNAWIQLDLKNKNEQGNYESKQFHKNYGFDLEQSLVKFPIKELGITEDKEALMKSLQKGNIQSVIFQLNGNEQKMFIEANPQFKTVNIYDKDMKLMQHESLRKDQPVAQTNSQESQQESKQAAKDKEMEKGKEINQSKKNSKALKAEKSDSLLPKKRTSHKKGLSV